MKSITRRQVKYSAIIIIVVIIAIIVSVYIRNSIISSLSVPSKESRKKNLLVGNGAIELSLPDVAHEVNIALSANARWDNLFLSEHFKDKYKNRKNILEDEKNIVNICSAVPLGYGENVIAIFAEKKSSFFDTDKSDDITTEYYFQYFIDKNGEIDDIILLKKQDVYTIDGEPVREE